VARCSAAITQIILGLYLTSQDFGLYATALGILGLTACMRAGGVATYLPSMKPEEYDREAGRLFGWAAICMATGASITSAVAQPVANWYGQPMLAWVLWILAARNLVTLMSLQARMRMAIDLRFRELAVLDTVIAVSKLGLACLLAWWLDETPEAVLALAVPYAASACIEFAYCIPASGVRIRHFTPKPKRLIQTAKQLRWPLALAVLISVNSQTNFVVISLITPVAAVGWIYFAYQLASQPMTLLASGLTNVFAPIMARERGNPAKERETITRVFSGAMLLVPFFFFGATAVFPAAEELVYRGRWEPANWPFFFLSVGFCFATATGVLTGSLLGLRRFQTLTGFEAMRAIGLIGGAFIGFGACLLLGLDFRALPSSQQTASADLRTAIVVISAATGASVAIMAITQLWLIMRQYRMPTVDFARNIAFGPLVALLTMVAAQSVGNSVTLSIHPGALSATQLAVVQLLLTTVTYATVTLICVRFLAEETLRRTVEVLPKGFQPAVRRVLRF
jgi:O-antigen/teichoic acid export membrane protein